MLPGRNLLGPGGKYWTYLQGTLLLPRCSETSANSCQTTLRHNPENTLHIHHCQNYTYSIIPNVSITQTNRLILGHRCLLSKSRETEIHRVGKMRSFTLKARDT